MTPAGTYFLSLFFLFVFYFLFFWIVQYSWNYGIRVISNQRVPVISYTTAAFVCLFFMAFCTLLKMVLVPWSIPYAVT